MAPVVALLCAWLAYSTRYTRSPDGVSYLDLAAALARGDWSVFLQGYWSPLYPALIAGASRLTGATGMALVPIAHLINAIAVSCTVIVIWLWARKFSDPFFGRAALAALLLCSARPPRVEAVTPDLLVLFMASWLAYELVVHGGRRWWLIGTLCGLMFLSKTSVWPWLMVAAFARWFAARKPGQHRPLMAAALVSFAMMLFWVVPLSLKTGQPTLGSTARLNFCWYLAQCDSRTPDTHSGNHTSYQTVRLGDGREVAVARFAANSPWTYPPWGDPTAWEQGVLSERHVTPGIGELLSYWSSNAVIVVWFWMGWLLLGVLAPMCLAARRPGLFLELRGAQRDAAVVMVLGVLGIAQFIAIHVEPRLIAPFALMIALGALGWFGASPSRSRRQAKAKPNVSRRWMWQICSGLGVGLALAVMIPRLREGIAADQRISAAIPLLRQTASQLEVGGDLGKRLVVVGPAIPILEDVYMLSWHIVAQVRPASVASIVSLPPGELVSTLRELFRGQADVAWVTMPDGTFQFVRIAGVAGR